MPRARRPFNMMKKEIWKNIKTYEDLYQINNHGRIKSLKRIHINKYHEKRIIKERILTGFISNGYCYISLQKDKFNNKKFRINRLVVQHFIDNPENKPQVNHEDGNKLNNYYENLKWMTNKENVIHAYNNNLMNAKHLERKVSVYDKNNNFIKSFKSRIEAGKWRNVSASQIKNYLHLRSKDPKKYIWKNK